MAYVSQLVINGTTYDIRDRTMKGALHFLGISTTQIRDGYADSPTIDGNPIPVADLNAGDIVLYRDSSDPAGTYKEFIWTADGNAGVWEELGYEGMYALKGTYTTSSAGAGKVWYAEIKDLDPEEIPTLTLEGTIPTTTLVVTGTTDPLVPPVSFSSTYTKATGIVIGDTTTESGHTFKGTDTDVSFTTDAFVTGADSITYTPGGTVGVNGNTTASGHTWSPTTTAVEVTGTVITSVGDHTLNPSTWTISAGQSKATITPVTGGSGIPLATYNSTNEQIIFYDLPTTQFVTSAAPAISQQTITLSHSYGSGTVTSTGTVLAQGSIMNSHKWTGTKATFTLSNYLTKATTTVSTTCVPQGTITGSHTLSTASATISFSKALVATLAALDFSASGEYDPSGLPIEFYDNLNIAQATFTNSIHAATAHTHTVTI